MSINIMTSLLIVFMIQMVCAPGEPKQTPLPTRFPTFPTHSPTAYPSTMPTQTPINAMHYFLPGIILSMNDSMQFCDEICDSDLASIHSVSQLNDAVNAINVRPKDVWATTLHRRDEAYIGLRSDDYPSIPFSWNDDSPFNYGNNTHPGTTPWKQDHPNGIDADTCVVLETDGGAWRDVPCHYDSFNRFICNDCNGKINKYALLNGDYATYNESDDLCLQIYGTSLASIHTNRDIIEITSLLRISQDNIAWIGLEYIYNDSMANYWEDGTLFDYGYVYNKSCESSMCCAVYNITHPQIWEYKPCQTSHAFICNLPSELSLALNTWTPVNGEWSYDPINLDIIHESIIDYYDDNNSEIILLNKQWFNGHDPLYIDFTFAIDSNPMSYGSDAMYGLNIYNGVNASDCNYYFIGVEYHSLDHYHVYLSRSDNDYDGLYELDDWWVDLDYMAQAQTQTLSIKITHGNSFDISVNSKYIEPYDLLQDMSYTDSRGYEVLTNGYSGYISLSAIDAETKIRAKQLYISGTPEIVTPLQIYAPESKCLKLPPPTKHPTNSPSNNPTISPSKNPTDSPTKKPTDYPTKHPTHYPTNDPTAVPTPETHDPSDAPSKYPIRQPSEMPTNSTVDPTTSSPTNHSSINTTTTENTVTETLTDNTNDNEHIKQIVANYDLWIVAALSAVICCIAVLVVKLAMYLIKIDKNAANMNATVNHNVELPQVPTKPSIMAPVRNEGIGHSNMNGNTVGHTLRGSMDVVQQIMMSVQDNMDKSMGLPMSQTDNNVFHNESGEESSDTDSEELFGPGNNTAGDNVFSNDVDHNEEKCSDTDSELSEKLFGSGDGTAGDASIMTQTIHKM
eukprot:141035_1